MVRGPLMQSFVGPVSAFRTNRCNRAIRKQLEKRTTTIKIRLSTKKRRGPRGIPEVSSPSPDTASVPKIRSLCTAEAVDSNAIHLAEAVEVKVDANVALERRHAVDETREAISEILKGLHSNTLCTNRQLSCAVAMLLRQRNFPKQVVSVLAKTSYKLFDVKALHFGDFIGAKIYVMKDKSWKTCWITAYHPFSGFQAEHGAYNNGIRENVTVGHDTLWTWA